MNIQDLDEQERARRKKDQVEWRTKRNTSNTFMLVSSLLQVVSTLILVAALIAIATAIMFNVLDLNGEAIQIAFPIVIMGTFLAGAIFSFVVYKKIARYFIKKLDLEDKLSDDVLKSYKYKKKSEKISEIQEQLKQ